MRRTCARALLLVWGVGACTLAGCSSGAPSLRELQREIDRARAQDAARDPGRSISFLRPVWYAGPGVPVDGAPGQQRMWSWLAEDAFRDAGVPAPPVQELWLRGREQPARWVLLHPAFDATAADLALVARAAQALAHARAAGVLPEARSGLAILLEPPTEARLHELRAAGEELFASVAFAAAVDGARESASEAGAPRAICVLERSPDPAATAPYAPDELLDWELEASGSLTTGADLASVVARCALVDLGESLGGWAAGERPWRGERLSRRSLPDGTAHLWLRRVRDPGFLNNGPGQLPAEEEDRRSLAAWLSIGWSLADAEPLSLDRYLQASLEELRVRREAARAAGDVDTADAWSAHQNAGVSWLRRLCLGLDRDEAEAIIRSLVPEAPDASEVPDVPEAPVTEDP